jgi:hypothetical protein
MNPKIPPKVNSTPANTSQRFGGRSNSEGRVSV